MAHDAFYALNELFEFSAASIDQLLELFEGNVRTTSYNLDTTRLSELLIAKTLVDDYRHYVKDILGIISARGGPKWPRLTDPEHCRKSDRAAGQLESRYQRLLGRCDHLLGHCTSSITILMTTQSQRQAEVGIEQTNRLSKLSLLAYVYIPLTFVSGLFGMNLRELGNRLSIWTYFAVAVPLSIASIIAWFINVDSVLARCRSFWKLVGSWTRGWGSSAKKSDVIDA